MAIDPNRLRALAAEKSTTPSPGIEEEEYGEGVEEGAEESGGPTTTGPARPGSVLPFLIKYADEIEASSDDMDYDILMDTELELSEEDMTMLQEGILLLPPRLQKNLWHLGGIDLEDSVALAQAVDKESEFVSDVTRFAGWLFRVGELMKPEEPEDDLDQMPPDDGEDDEFEDDESESGLTA